MCRCGSEGQRQVCGQLCGVNVLTSPRWCLVLCQSSSQVELRMFLAGLQKKATLPTCTSLTAAISSQVENMSTS